MSITNELFEIELLEKNYFYGLEDDEDFAKSYFITKTNNNTGDKTLVPQFWWGNLEEPSIVILAKNPSYKTKGKKNDVIDNTTEKTRDYFINNIKRNESNFDFNFFDKIPDSFVVDWWKNKFFVQQKLDDLKDKIAILNLFGYYSTDSDYLEKISNNDLQRSHIYKNSSKIKDLLKKNSVKAIIFLWQGSEKVWNKVLSSNEEMNEKFFDDKSIRKKLYFANYKNGRNPKFIDIISYDDKNKIDNMSKANLNEILSEIKKESR